MYCVTTAGRARLQTCHSILASLLAVYTTASEDGRERLTGREIGEAAQVDFAVFTPGWDAVRFKTLLILTFGVGDIFGGCFALRNRAGCFFFS